MTTPTTCPRCNDESGIRHLADSPLPGVWTVWGCPRCNFVWRSTENLQGLRHLTAAEIDDAYAIEYTGGEE